MLQDIFRNQDIRGRQLICDGVQFAKRDARAGKGSGIVQDDGRHIDAKVVYPGPVKMF